MKKAASILFHRTALVGLLLVLQVAILVVVMARFASYFIYFYLFCVVVSILVVLWIVNARTDPGYKIAWIVPILLAPCSADWCTCSRAATSSPPGCAERWRVWTAA